METYDAIIQSLQKSGVRYQPIAHPPEGRTAPASKLRGNRLEQAAKAMVVRVDLPAADGVLVLAVLPGHRRVDFEALSRRFGGHSADLASKHSAEEITGCVMGSVPPVSFHHDLKLVVDPELLAEEEIVFSAGRLDLSIRIKSSDYVTWAKPEIAAIAEQPW
jgi:Ala-tRNA(Pro) deacylase